MKLQLKNIGIIKEANVKLDGLTVIAGENDTGKSTLSKALFFIYNGMFYNSGGVDYLPDSPVSPRAEVIFEREFLFSKKIFGKNSFISISEENEKFEIDSWMNATGNLTQNKLNIHTMIFIETPIVWNFQKLFRNLSETESYLKQIGEEIDIEYPFLMKDLSFKLFTKKKEQYEKNNFIAIKNNIISIIDGEFFKDEDGIFRFYRKDKKFDMIDVAVGIKTFGIIQVLIDNNRLNEHSFLIIDEPEVHLHPKWQLELAKIIVKLVKNNVRVLVNSHSPYMIEALKRYSERAGNEIENKTNFYLAKNGYITQIEDSNHLTLSAIFEKLSEPFVTFDEMDSKRMEITLNG